MPARREPVLVLAAGRVAAGGALLVAPGPVLGVWAGPGGRTPQAGLLGRALGVRDVLLGLGTIRAVQDGQSLRPWLLANAAADGIDGLATLLAWRHLGRSGRALVLGAALSATAVALFLARQEQDDPAA